MKIRLLSLFFILYVFGLYGCTFLIPKHETKTKAEFYADQNECDKKARTYVNSLNIYIERPDDAQANEHLNYSRRCLKEKGWYYFK